MKAMTLSEIAQILHIEKQLPANAGNIAIHELSTDTRQITSGCLFIALKGERFDANDFIGQALERGATAVVCSRRDTVAGGIQLVVEDTTDAYQALAKAYCARFSIPKVALTGSVGKTTTKELTAAVLSQKYHVLKTEGNWNNQIGVPRMAFRMEEEHTAAVFEMGMDHAGQIRKLSNIVAPDVGILTNIGLCHIENLGSQEAILASKLELLEGMKPTAPVVINGDDPLLRKAAEKMKNPVILYGIHSRGCYAFADKILQEGESTRFLLHLGEKKIEVKLPALGEHIVSDALAAAAVGELLGIPPEAIACGLESYASTGRRQRVVRLPGLTVIEDCYNASPDAVKASLRTLMDFPEKGRKIAVLGDMKELGDYSSESHKMCGAYAAQLGVDLLFAYGEQSRLTAQAAAEGGIPVFCETEPEAMAKCLLNQLGEGDTVVFKASHSMKLEEVIALLYEGWQKK